MINRRELQARARFKFNQSLMIGGRRTDNVTQDRKSVKMSEFWIEDAFKICLRIDLFLIKFVICKDYAVLTFFKFQILTLPNQSVFLVAYTIFIKHLLIF
jgi:hypothetical protein